MDYLHLLDRLKVVLKQHLPEERSHAGQLSEILGIKPHSVYRKLKGEIQFSVDDLIKISAALSIPVGNLLDDYSCVYTHPMELLIIENMSKERGYRYATDTAHEIFDQAGKSGNSRFTAVCKSLPVVSYYYYNWLMKFAHLKWMYFNTQFTGISSLAELEFPDEYMELKDMYIEAFNSMRRLTFIVDGDMVRNFMIELLFFRKIAYITSDEMRFLLEDLKNMLMQVEDICKKGETITPEQEIQIFYSDIALHNDIYLVESKDFNLGIFYAQGFNPVIHKEPQTFSVFKNWIDAWLRCSNLICGAGQMNRKIFFEKQYRMIEKFRESTNIPDYFNH